MKNQLSRFALAAAMLTITVPAHAAETVQWTMGAGFEYSSGKYGTTSTTESLSIPIYAQYSTGAWKLRLTVPYLQVTGDGSVIVSGRQSGWRANSTTTSTQRTQESGLGDIVAAVSRNLASPDDYAIVVDLTGRVKFGTASKTMGSGLNDYAVQVSAYAQAGNFSPGILLGYEVPGDTTAQPLSNVAYGAISGNYQFNDMTSAGAEYRYGQRATDTGFEQREMSVYANYRYAQNRLLGLYVMKGFSDGSPDNGAGISLSAGF